MHLYLIHNSARELNKTARNESTATGLTLVHDATYATAAQQPPYRVMARPHSQPYLETTPPGVNIYRLRMARGWNQAQLARACRPPMTPSAISRLEHNDGYTQDSLQRIATALGVPIEALFYPPEIVHYARLPADIRDRLANTIADATAAYDARQPRRPWR